MKKNRKKALLEGHLLKVPHLEPSESPPLEFLLDVETIRLGPRDPRRVRVKAFPVS